MNKISPKERLASQTQCGLVLIDIGVGVIAPSAADHLSDSDSVFTMLHVIDDGMCSVLKCIE